LIKSDCVFQERRKTNKNEQGKNAGVTMAMFAAGLAHELTNPLDAVRRYLNLAWDQAKDDPVTRDYLAKAKQGVFQAFLAMNEFVAYSQQCYQSASKIVEIHSFLKLSLNALSEYEESKAVTIQKNFHPEPLYVEDRGLLLVFHNLYKNAFQAMEGRGILTLSTWRQNGSVGISVQDTGKGIPEGIRGRIFEPFFSTKKENQGTGIGLCLSREIVERCGGELRFENVSEPDSGARFVIILPLKKIDADLKESLVPLHATPSGDLGRQGPAFEQF